MVNPIPTRRCRLTKVRFAENALVGERHPAKRRHMEMIVLGTLGNLLEHDYGVFGYCLACRRSFDVSLPELIADTPPPNAIVRSGGVFQQS
jgi:hypothetical protein